MAGESYQRTDSSHLGRSESNAKDPPNAPAGREQGGDYSQDRRLAGPVGTLDREAFAFFNTKRDGLDDWSRTGRHSYIGQLDQVGHSREV